MSKHWRHIQPCLYNRIILARSSCHCWAASLHTDHSCRKPHHILCSMLSIWCGFLLLWSVCLLVLVITVSPGKTVELIGMPFGVGTWGDQKYRGIGSFGEACNLVLWLPLLWSLVVIITNCISEVGNAISFICLSVWVYSNVWTEWPLTLMDSDHSCLGLKVKVVGHNRVSVTSSEGSCSFVIELDSL